VIVLGAEEGIFPTRHAVSSAEIEEERRLFMLPSQGRKDIC